MCGLCSPVGGIRMTRRAAVIGQSDALLYYYFSGIFPTVINYFIYLYCSHTPPPHHHAATPVQVQSTSRFQIFFILQGPSFLTPFWINFGTKLSYFLPSPKKSWETTTTTTTTIQNLNIYFFSLASRIVLLLERPRRISFLPPRRLVSKRLQFKATRHFYIRDIAKVGFKFSFSF